APDGRWATVICVGLLMVKTAGVPLKVTPSTSVCGPTGFVTSKLVPLMTTDVPVASSATPPVGGAGVNDITTGSGCTVNVGPAVVPDGFTTEIGPVVAPFGANAVIVVSLSTLKTAGLLPKVTAVAPVKFDPVSTTLVVFWLLAGPLDGVKDVIVGVPATMKFPALVPVPMVCVVFVSAVVTAIGPDVAEAGTLALILVVGVTGSGVNVALTPLNVTALAPPRFAPVI